MTTQESTRPRKFTEVQSLKNSQAYAWARENRPEWFKDRREELGIDTLALDWVVFDGACGKTNLEKLMHVDSHTSVLCRIQQKQAPDGKLYYLHATPEEWVADRINEYRAAKERYEEWFEHWTVLLERRMARRDFMIKKYGEVAVANPLSSQRLRKSKYASTSPFSNINPVVCVPPVSWAIMESHVYDAIPSHEGVPYNRCPYCLPAFDTPRRQAPKPQLDKHKAERALIEAELNEWGRRALAAGEPEEPATAGICDDCWMPESQCQCEEQQNGG